LTQSHSQAYGESFSNARARKSNSIKPVSSLSMVYFKQRGYKKKLIVSTLQIINAIKTLASMVTEAQLEKQVYG
jgi:hypothetical protein